MARSGHVKKMARDGDARAMPAPSTARKAAIDRRWTSRTCASVNAAGITAFEPSSRYFAS